jgi:hypothetical protein
LNKIGLCKKARLSYSLKHHSWQDSSNETTEIMEVDLRLKELIANQTASQIERSTESNLLTSSLNSS